MTAGSGLELRGLDVHQVVTVPADPAVTHGSFVVRNPGPQPRRLSVIAAAVTGETASVPVPRFYVYRLPSYDEVTADSIEIPPGTDDSFVVSFAAVPLATGLAAQIAVALDVIADGIAAQVVSPWSCTIRTPRR